MSQLHVIMENYVFFWRIHEEDAYLSQWYTSPFTTKAGLRFVNAEQYMMYYKAITFNDFETADIIYESYNEHPRFHKSMGRKVKNFDMKKWREVCENIVFHGNMYKFVQNRSIMQLLLDTNDKILVEASPKDSLWGIGYDKNMALDNTESWGENLLGKVLTKVRNTLRNDENFHKYENKVFIGFGD